MSRRLSTFLSAHEGLPCISSPQTKHIMIRHEVHVILLHWKRRTKKKKADLSKDQEIPIEASQVCRRSKPTHPTLLQERLSALWTAA